MTDSKGEPVYGSIGVPLAVFWSEPNEEPIYEEISQQAATNTGAWSGSLDPEKRLWLVGKVDTMALYGESVIVLDCQNNWLKVAAVSQPTSQNKLGYPGWVVANQIVYDQSFLKYRINLTEAVISIPKATVFSDPALTKPLRLLSYQTRLPIIAECEDYFKVQLPDGTAGYLCRTVVKKTSALSFSNENIVVEARRFLDLRYIWGGTSNYGFDCSGFMFRLYQSQGISIPRDASEQARAGAPVAKENLQPGDLLFFAHGRSQAKIHHVAMYIGEGLMIHSPNSKSAVRIEPFEAGIYGEEYWGARRYYGH